MNNKNIFAKNLKKYMESNNKTRKDVCKDLGFNYYTFSDWVNGKKYPRMDKVEMLANYFGVLKSDLIEDNPRAEMKDRLMEALDVRGKKAVDLSKFLDIPKSAISQYLSGKSKDMDSRRLYSICVYLNVQEAWLMGYDVPMDRPSEMVHKEELMDEIRNVTHKMRDNEGFRNLILKISALNPSQLAAIDNFIDAFHGLRNQ